MIMVWAPAQTFAFCLPQWRGRLLMHQIGVRHKVCILFCVEFWCDGVTSSCVCYCLHAFSGDMSLMLHSCTSGFELIKIQIPCKGNLLISGESLAQGLLWPIMPNFFFFFFCRMTILDNFLKYLPSLDHFEQALFINDRQLQNPSKGPCSCLLLNPLLQYGPVLIMRD